MNPEKVDKTDVVCIGDITLPMLGDGIRKCSKVVPDSCFGGRIKDFPLSWFDPELSTCIITNETVTGVFLVHKDGDMLFPEYLCICGADAKADSRLLLQKAAAALWIDYPEETQIVIRCRDERTRQQIEKLFLRKDKA